MDDTFLYHQIAESIRNDILTGQLKPGDRLPSVRKLCENWNCTPGTIQRAYKELAREGLLVSRAGRGTQVAGAVPQAKAQAQGTMRRASLVNRAEAFLLEVLTAGYDLNEISQAVDLAMDRWRTLQATPESRLSQIIRFAGSHDMVINALAHDYFGRLAENSMLQITYCGSLNGLIALAEGKADVAGCHLWDAESNTYNIPFARRLLPGRQLKIVTLAYRRIGLILAAGNPLGIHNLPDIALPDVRFINRQAGSGTRVWLDESLARLGIAPQRINGYADERMTHTDVARSIAEGTADVGIGLETAAQAYGLDFIYLNRERYDLVMLVETAQQPVMRKFTDWLASQEGKTYIAQFPGYDGEENGVVQLPL